MSVQEIEAAIIRLSGPDLAELARWLDDYRARQWDEQITDDLNAGRLDALLDEVDREYDAGLARPL